MARYRIACALLLTSAAWTWAAGPVSQAQAPAAAARSSAPRTPWGDPDLQGVYANDDEYATPLERPDEFAGRTLADLSAADLARVRASAQQRMVAALPGGRVRGPDEWWLQNLDLSRRNQPWLIVDPPDGRIPALTPQGQARAKAARPRGSFLGGPFDSPDDFSLLDRCITRGVPGAMIPVMYSNVYEIVQAPGTVAITYEIAHEVRVIPLDGRPHVGAAIRGHMGDARGRWEGDTLVVETTNVTAAAAYRGANPATLRVTERFTPAGADTIAWSATLDDPGTWTRPWTIAMPLRRYPHPLLPFDCHEHNYGLMNILRGARAVEAAGGPR